MNYFRSFSLRDLLDPHRYLHRLHRTGAFKVIVGRDTAGRARRGGLLAKVLQNITGTNKPSPDEQIRAQLKVVQEFCSLPAESADFKIGLAFR
jgi:hypothetical protein